MEPISIGPSKMSSIMSYKSLSRSIARHQTTPPMQKAGFPKGDCNISVHRLRYCWKSSASSICILIAGKGWKDVGGQFCSRISRGIGWEAGISIWNCMPCLTSWWTSISIEDMPQPFHKIWTTVVASNIVNSQAGWTPVLSFLGFSIYPILFVVMTLGWLCLLRTVNVWVIGTLWISRSTEWTWRWQWWRAERSDSSPNLDCWSLWQCNKEIPPVFWNMEILYRSAKTNQLSCCCKGYQ